MGTVGTAAVRAGGEWGPSAGFTSGCLDGGEGRAGSGVPQVVCTQTPEAAGYGSLQPCPHQAQQLSAGHTDTSLCPEAGGGDIFRLR